LINPTASTCASETAAAYPTAAPSHASDLPEMICDISCSVKESTSTSSYGETGVYKRSLGSTSDDSEIALDESPPVTRPSVQQDGLDAPVLPDGVFADDGDCGRRVRPIAPQIPWGWPSKWKSGHRAPYMCHYHAATLPECKNIHDQAVASYCVKSPRPGLCKARACQVLDQCKSIIASGRGYCWNPRWFV